MVCLSTLRAPRATSGKVIMPPPVTDEPDLFQLALLAAPAGGRPFECLPMGDQFRGCPRAPLRRAFLWPAR
jgi:hypothetical protein